MQLFFYYRKHEGNIGSNQELRLWENIKALPRAVALCPFD